MLKRHNLLNIDNDGRCYALKNVSANTDNINMDILSQLILSDIPAITARQPIIDCNYIWVGFSSTQFINNNHRLRVSAKVPAGSVTETLTPFDVIDLWRKNRSLNQHNHIIDCIMESGKRNQINIGLYGSIALAIVTGKNYITPRSDVDIYISATPEADIGAFHQDILRLEQKFATSIDCEFEIKDHYACKLKELFSRQKTVLLKGLYSAEIINIPQIYQ